MSKLKFIQNEQTDLYPEPIYIYNSELKKIVTKTEHQGIEFICRDELYSGTQILEINGDTKLIIEYKDATWPNEKLDAYCSGSPYKKVNGSLINLLPIEDIINYSKEITVYTASGKKILNISRGELWEYHVRDFNIKFNENVFILGIFNSIYNVVELEKIVYNYNGKTLDKKYKKINSKEFLKETINQDTPELIK